MGSKALIKQRTGNKSGADLKKVEQLLASHKGLTATQLSWMAAGGSLDEQGFCQPAALFSQCLDFFNIKRRISERAYEIDKLGDHPRALFRYGRAVKNPYDFGGQGIYPKGDMQSLSYERPRGGAYVKPVAVEPVAPACKADASAMVADMKALLD